MKRIATLAIAMTIAGVCCVVAAFFCQFYYARYQSAVSELDKLKSHINYFETHLGTLEAHKSRELTPVRVSGLISTRDRPLNEHYKGYGPWETHPDNFFEAINGKGGAVIIPELRLAADSATNIAYDIQVASQFGIVADAWLSHAEPYQDLAAFDEFRVLSRNRTNSVTLIARLKSGASVQMRFEVVILCEQ